MTPTWLPALADTNGTWEQIQDRLYQIFNHDFRKKGCSFNGQKVMWDTRKLEDNFDEGFWHLITKENSSTRVREFDPPRAKRLPWCKPIIESSTNSDVKLWKYKEKGRKNIYLWLEHFDYVVIIQDRGKVVFLVTAYFVEGESSRRNLRKKYDKRVV